MSCLASYGMSNAFPSISRTSLDDVGTGAQLRCDENTFFDHHRAAVFLFQAQDQAFSFAPTCGAFPGSSVATEYFNYANRRCVLNP